METVNDSSTIQTGITALTVVMCLIQSFFTWAGNRDRMKFDLHVNSLLTTIESLKERSEICETDRAALRTQLETEKRERLQSVKEIQQELQSMHQKLLQRLAGLHTRLRRLAEIASRGIDKELSDSLPQSTAVGDPPDPCLEEVNALDAALYELDQLLLTIQERTEALEACRNANSEQPPG